MSHIYDALRRALPRTSFEFPQVAEAPPVSPQSPALDCDSATPVQYSIRPGARLPVLEDRSSLAAEKFRALAARLRHMRDKRALKTLLVTSSGPKEGKTFVSANLALALALVPQQKVLLLEGDLRKPMLMRTFGLSSLPGMIEYFHSNDHGVPSIYRLEDPALYLLPAGRRTGAPLDTLYSTKLGECLRKLSNGFDWVIVDSPPILPIADANLWAQHCDGILLVVREGRSSVPDLKRSLDALDNQNVVAVVLNDCSRTTRQYSYHYHY